jgi:hypothetical protein
MGLCGTGSPTRSGGLKGRKGLKLNDGHLPFPHPAIFTRGLDQSRPHRILEDIIGLLFQTVIRSQDMIEEFLLLDWTMPVEKLVDSPSRYSLNGMHDLRQAEVPSIQIPDRTQQEVGVIWHHDRRMQVELAPVFL